MTKLKGKAQALSNNEHAERERIAKVENDVSTSGGRSWSESGAAMTHYLTGILLGELHDKLEPGGKWKNVARIEIVMEIDNE
jgi:hypothetical protein